MARQNVPGPVWKSHGIWHWKVKFPDDVVERTCALLPESLGMRVTDRYSFEEAEREMLREAAPAALALGQGPRRRD